ncbi:hypothetical protein KR032_001808 [Drosophila birchii]|nr:hypothetical protein KR032_001808 [Drosophila birchii]
MKPFSHLLPFFLPLFPAGNNPQDDAEVINVPSRPQTESDFHNFRGVIDTGSGYPFLQPNPSSFNLGFFDSFDDLFRRLRTRLWPAIGSDSSDEAAAADSDESSVGLGSGFSLGLPLAPLNPKDGNTTSTVKVVDGHKVEINETVFGNTNSVFKVRVVNVRPLDSGEEVAEGVHTNDGGFQPAKGPATSAPPPAKSAGQGEFDDEDEEDGRREPLEKQPKDNEVRDIDEPKSTTTTTTTTVRSTTSTLASRLPEDSESEATDISEDIVETLSVEEQKKTMDKLQEMMASMQKEVEKEEALEQDHQEQESMEMMKEKEREEFDSSDDEDAEATTPVVMSETFNDEWSEFDQDHEQDQEHELDIEGDFENDLNNDIDIEENFVPVDLSNDIAVNDLAAADPDFPHNPDAEVFAPPTLIKAMPMFEKLSLSEPSK